MAISSAAGSLQWYGKTSTTLYRPPAASMDFESYPGSYPPLMAGFALTFGFVTQVQPLEIPHLYSNHAVTVVAMDYPEQNYLRGCPLHGAGVWSTCKIPRIQNYAECVVPLHRTHWTTVQSFFVSRDLPLAWILFSLSRPYPMSILMIQFSGPG